VFENRAAPGFSPERQAQPPLLAGDDAAAAHPSVEAARGDAMGLFNLFGGKKKDEAKPASPGNPVAAKAVEAKPVEARPAANPAAPAPAVQVAVGLRESGVTQVKLRLKLAASLRAGEHGEAYRAAKDLAAIQKKAGRRVGARVWAAEAERILAKQEAA
jgi:hypothetical protein